MERELTYKGMKKSIQNRETTNAMLSLRECPNTSLQTCLQNTKSEYLNSRTITSGQLICLGFLLFLFGTLRAQEVHITSSIVISNFLVSEIVNNPENMKVEGYYLEFEITEPGNLNQLVFEVQRFPEGREPELYFYPFEIIKKEDGVYLVIQHNHFHIENGRVGIRLTIDPKNLVDNTKYQLTGMDLSGLSITPVKFSKFQ